MSGTLIIDTLQNKKRKRGTNKMNTTLKSWYLKSYSMIFINNLEPLVKKMWEDIPNIEKNRRYFLYLVN